METVQGNLRVALYIYIHTHIHTSLTAHLIVPLHNSCWLSSAWLLLTSFASCSLLLASGVGRFSPSMPDWHSYPRSSEERGEHLFRDALESALDGRTG